MGWIESKNVGLGFKKWTHANSELHARVEAKDRQQSSYAIAETYVRTVRFRYAYGSSYDSQFVCLL